MSKEFSYKIMIICVQAYMGVCTIQTWYAGSCGILSPSQGWQQNHANHITAGQSSPLHKDGSRKIMQITKQQDDLLSLKGWQHNHANHTTAE
jgi:hypothetical protein